MVLCVYSSSELSCVGAPRTHHLFCQVYRCRSRMMRRQRDLRVGDVFWHGTEFNIERSTGAAAAARPDLPLLMCACPPCAAARADDPAVFDHGIAWTIHDALGREYRIVAVAVHMSFLPPEVIDIIDVRQPRFNMALLARFRDHVPRFRAGDAPFVLEQQHLLYLGAWVPATVDELGAFNGLPPRSLSEFQAFSKAQRSCWRLVKRLLGRGGAALPLFLPGLLAELIIGSRPIHFPRCRKIVCSRVVRETPGGLRCLVCCCARCGTWFQEAAKEAFAVLDPPRTATVHFDIDDEADVFVVQRACAAVKSWDIEITHAIYIGVRRNLNGDVIGAGGFTNLSANEWNFGFPRPPRSDVDWDNLSHMRQVGWQAIEDLVLHPLPLAFVVARRIAQLLVMQ